MATDWNGDTIWTRTYGGQQDEFGNGIRLTADNGIAACGHTEGFGNPTFQSYLIKTDSAGRLQCDNPATFRMSDTLICAEEQVNLTNTTVSSGPYQWWVNDSLYTGFNPTLYMDEPGAYDIAFTTCLDTAYGQLQVRALPNASFTYELFTDTVQFYLTGDTNSSAGVQWQFGDTTAPATSRFNPWHV
jgi:hypothetical protein